MVHSLRDKVHHGRRAGQQEASQDGRLCWPFSQLPTGRKQETLTHEIKINKSFLKVFKYIFKKYFYSVCVFCLHLCVCVSVCADTGCSTQRSQKRASYLELELQMVVSAGN